MDGKRSIDEIKSEIAILEEEAITKEVEMNKLNNKIDRLYSELRVRIQEEKTKAVEVSVTYGGRLPVAPERDWRGRNEEKTL